MSDHKPLTDEDLQDIEKVFYDKPDVQTLIAEIRELRQADEKSLRHIEGVQQHCEKIKSDNARLREALKDLLDAFWDMSPLEYASSRKLRDSNGLVCMSDVEGERIKDKARAILEKAGDERRTEAR